MILELSSGRRVKVREGETVSVGRTDSAMQIFDGDPRMSTLHFAVSLSAGTLRLQNFSHTNGTLVNGTRVEAAVLQAGDTIAAGGTVFTVIGPPPNPYAAQMRAGGWGFEVIPAGWKAMDGVGLVRDGGEFRGSAAGLEESLPEGKTLADYVAVQKEVAMSRLKGAEFEGPLRARMAGAEEALLLTVTSVGKDGSRVAQRQIYARSGDVVGILTLTAPAAAHQELIEIVHGASFHKPQIVS